MTQAQRTVAQMQELWEKVRAGTATEADLVQYGKDKRVMRHMMRSGDYGKR